MFYISCKIVSSIYCASFYSYIINRRRNKENLDWALQKNFNVEVRITVVQSSNYKRIIMS